jgi:glutathione synthase/RimK-type ligase-like ATP-grasp enzyme
VEVVAARRYLTDPAFHRMTNTRVFNLCRSYGYQSLGYYVSLLAEARAQRPEPDTITIQDMKSSALVRAITEDLEPLIQKTLRTVNPVEFTLSVYFGKTLAKRDEQLGRRLFGRFKTPLLRAQFHRRQEHWQLRSVRPIPASEIPDSHHPTVVAAAEEYFAKRYRTEKTAPPPRYDLAILHDPAEEEPPSNPAAIRRFIRAAHRQEMGAELITKDDFARIAEFDALLIRTTTFMNHYTYRFARRASAEGLAVIDDPLSIARCTNKVYLAELFKLHKIRTPHTMIVQRDNVDDIAARIGFPLVLKQPDSSFSQGVVKVSDAESLHTKAEELLDKSEAVIAQAFMPTGFDWRIGVLDGQPLYACKYFMARNHWQIVKWNPSGKTRYGKTETVTIDQAPEQIVKTAVRAARLIGHGLYGVDLKLIDNKAYVIEVNDNPNIDAMHEDRVLGDELYDRIINSLIQRIRRTRERTREPGKQAEPQPV